MTLFRDCTKETMKDSNIFPVKFTHNRPRCLYKGGRHIDEFFGTNEIYDIYRPEEWIGSIIESTTNISEIREGLSHIIIGDKKVLFEDYISKNPARILGEKHFRKFGNNPAILIKLIDSAVRLLIQVHPDNAYAEIHLNSQFGKTEAWYVLDTDKEIDKPYLLLGFKPETNKKKWYKAFNEQNIKILLNSLHKIPAKKGDVFLIEGGMPHAIGEGCFILEIQEPTDFTMRVEKFTPWGTKVPEELMHQGTGFENMMDCFDYTTYTQEDLIRKAQRFPNEIYATSGGRETALLENKDRKYFFLTKIDIDKTFFTKNQDVFFIIIITKGSGAVMSGGKKLIDFSKGDEIFFPADSGDLVWENIGEDSLEIIRCFPPV